MVSSIADIGIFICTVFAHGKFFHHSTRPVIGKRLDDGISWPAIRTVDKRVTVSAVRRAAELGFTLGTCGNIGGYESGACTYAAAAYCKAVKCSGALRRIRRSFCNFCPDCFNLCHRRRRRFQLCDEMLQVFRISLQYAFQSCGGVAYPAADMVPCCKAVKKRAKAYTLYDSFDFNMNGPHDCAFLACSAINSASPSMPSPLRLLTLKSGAFGLTVS